MWRVCCLLASASLARTELAHAGGMCHIPCNMDGRTGTCHTAFCGTGPGVGCCKQGLAQAPCDGIMGCLDHQCCTSTVDSQQHADPIKYGQIKYAPPPPPPPQAAPSYSEQQCPEGKVAFRVLQSAHLMGSKSGSYMVGVSPWQEYLNVVLLFRSHGDYVQVVEEEGASLHQPEQIGAFLRLTFALADEPAGECPHGPCFNFETVGALGLPDSIACTMPAEFVDPPPSPPPRYIPRGELWGHGELSLPPPLPLPPPPPTRRPPLLSSRAHASEEVMGGAWGGEPSSLSRGATTSYLDTAQDNGQAMGEAWPSTSAAAGVDALASAHTANGKADASSVSATGVLLILVGGVLVAHTHGRPNRTPNPSSP